MALTLCLVVILTTLTLTLTSHLNRFIVHAELEKLTILFLHAQQKAIMLNKDFTIACDIHSHCYTFESTCYTLCRGIQFGYLEGAMGPPSNPQKNITKPITYTNNTIVFFKDGTVSSGTLYIIDNHRQALYALTTQVGTLPFIRKYRYEKNCWILLS